ncbi:Acetyl esterase/lipase [Ruminococcus sp. YE71]|uniref:alpha/beta hydrolase n=1 Tax=unclassified Ruminococcus TaxID=2608920 RepID=UPI000889BE5A|nr:MULTISPECIES: alpha/beta hydrolase [unclassified Ruminococcus]SDA26221.1 Acetyl esterase/lipase [Ruminococcus sp. YE78]SFW35999.1 Acetyl esterase/lipase [Ruminococcus sp. YE71]
MSEKIKLVSAPDARGNMLYDLTKFIVTKMKMKQSLVGTKEEVLAKAAKMNQKRSFQIIPGDNKAHYTDHLIGGKYHCVETDIRTKRQKGAILFVFGGGMILGSDKGDIGLCRKIAQTTKRDVWFPYYPLCHEHDILENVQMISECYTKMLRFYKPENIVFLGFSSGGALLLDLITYINERNDSGENIPMPGLLIPVSPGSVPVNDKERERIRRLEKKDIMIPASYMELAREIMCHGRDIPEKYLATAYGDFRNAPVTHFYYGSHETLYAFAPSYAESYKKAGADCIFHVGKGMHHCYALQYFIPGCKPAFDEIMELINGK